MNWKECVLRNERLGIRDRFDWPLVEGSSGFDCNSSFTINDITGAIGWVWTYPGDTIINSDAVREFFELGTKTFVGSGWSVTIGFAIVGICCWLLLRMLD